MLQRPQPTKRIDALAAEANSAHLAATRAGKEMVRFATEAGQALLAAKRLVGHGHWMRWIKQNLTFSGRTARLYMQLATLPEAKWQSIADLSLGAAVKAMAERQPQPKTSRPLPSPLAAALLDTCVQLEGADVVQGYLHHLKQANTVSVARFERAARWAKRQLKRQS
jgi:Protein of unknown function (DUF3102)